MPTSKFDAQTCFFLGFFFIFVGLLKLTPQINEDAHREVRKQFVQFSKVRLLTMPCLATIRSKESLDAILDGKTPQTSAYLIIHALPCLIMPYHVSKI